MMYIHFEGSCFCDDVQGVEKRQGLTHVQMQIIDKIPKTEDRKISSVGEGTRVIKQMMACKRILLVLDDVNKLEQLEALAGSPDWFYAGSLIIFTSKDKQLLKSPKVDSIYEMESLDEYKALELFSLYAFGKRHPAEDFGKFSSQIVKCLQGHPLALKVIGRSLYEKSIHVWKSELDRLQTYPNSEIVQKLRSSFDSLTSDQKRMFLDIACAFIGENKDFAASVLDSSNCYANAIIEDLADKFLITVSADYLHVHELIQSMAREIIREEFKQNRILWISSQDFDLLNVNKATEEVEVLVLLLKKKCRNIPIDGQALTRMKNLRILKICFPKVEGGRKPFAVNFSGRLDLLSNNLRLLYWHGCPFKILPSDFYPENIVTIDLSYSHIKQLWTTPKCFMRLKFMKLSHCCNLTTTPDFTEITNLEELDLEGCVNLVTIHPSIGMLKRLVVLNMRDCRRAMSRLNVNQVPQVFWSRWWTSIPGFIWNQQRPQRSVSLARLDMLKYLNFSYCNLEQVPESVGGLSCLKNLNLKGNNFTSLPGSLNQLSYLAQLHLDGCKKLEVLPKLPHSLIIMSARDCTSLCSVMGSSKVPIMTNTSCFLSNCPKLFTNLAIDSQLSISETQYLDKSITSQSSTNRFSSFLQYAGIQNNRCKFFRFPGSSIENMEIIYHGNSIPEWFTNKSMGNQVKVELSSDWCFNKFWGYGTCLVFKRKKPCKFIGYSIKNFDGAYLGHGYSYYFGNYSHDKPIRIHESYTIWLHYTRYKPKSWEEAKNFVTFCFKDKEDCEVKECGVRIVCDEDLEQDTTNMSMFQDFTTMSQHGGALSLSGLRRDTQWSW